MKSSITVEKLRIQEGEWIITLPITDTNTIQDLSDLVEQLRYPTNAGVIMKNGWKIDHI